MKFRILVALTFLFGFFTIQAQTYKELAGQSGSRVITTAVPFLQISPDARSGGMGELGVASTPDGASMHWNSAKYAFIEKPMGVTISYSPWLRELVNDINLAYLTYHMRINRMSTFAATMRYFSLGDILFTDEFGNGIGTYNPNEFSFDATYSRKFSEYFSGAVAARFIYSNLTQGQYVQGAETSAGTSIAVDVGLYYQKEVDLLQGRLNALQREARERRTSMILLFEGWDAAGKGGAIRRVIQPLDARYYQVISVAAPTDEERAHHYLWRFWRHMPRAGRVTIFDRSWYGRVLVERVERFATPREWMRAYGEINHFEGELLEHGMGLLKFWIHITPEEQEGRFRARSQSPLKSWKLTAEDWRNRERWGAYERAVNDMVEHTSTRLAPWTLIEGNDKRYARVRVLQEVCRRFEEVLDGKLGSRPGARARKRGHAGRAGR